MTSEQWFKPETSFGIISFNDDEYSEYAMNKKMFMFSGHQVLIPVTSETQNTVEFLKKYNLFKYLENNVTKEEMIEKIKMETRRYAKRQLTWFNRNKDINWVYPDEQGFDGCINNAQNLVKEFLGGDV